MGKNFFSSAGMIALLVAMPLLQAAAPTPGPDAAAPVVSPGAVEIPERLVRLTDGRRIHLHCAGRGSPTILFESAFASTSQAWYKVQPKIAETHQACAYDRAGYALSDPGPLPRDGKAIAADLDEALRAAHIDGPFVVVGHSAGGLYVRVFADLHPRNVVGMVLVDPSVEHQDQRFAAFFGPGAASLKASRAGSAACLRAAENYADHPSGDTFAALCIPQPRPNQTAAMTSAIESDAKRASLWRTRVSELDNLWTTTSDEIDKGRGRYGSMPLIVLTADGTYAAMPQPTRAVAEWVWRSVHQEIAARSTRGVERLVTGTSHQMVLDRPDAIVDAISQVIAAARTGQPIPPSP
jgi:pimeloyl-ACP methyl ester carboxylesterase